MAVLGREPIRMSLIKGFYIFFYIQLCCGKTVNTFPKTPFPQTELVPRTDFQQPFPEPTQKMTGSNSTEHEKIGRWVVFAPAIPTVMIFVIVVMLIALKNYISDKYSYDRSMPDFGDDEADGNYSASCSSCCQRGKNKQAELKEDYKKELYDHMWKDWQEQRGSKKKHGQRKSSQIVLEGFSSSSPRTLARKHLALNNLSPDDRRPSALGTLIKLSSRAAIASTILEGDEDTTKRSSSKELGEDTQCLLPPRDVKRLSFRELPIWQQEDMRKIEEESDEFEGDPKDSKKGKKMTRSGSSSSFKYRKLSRQTKVNTEDSDSDGSYDCAQHIQNIIGASKDNLDGPVEADDAGKCNETTSLNKITTELLPINLHETLADLDRWPESAM